MLKKLPRTITIIAISHHISALEFMDKIITIEKGSIVDYGLAKPLPSKTVPMTMHAAPASE